MCQGLVKAYTEGHYDALKQSCVPTTKLSEENYIRRLWLFNKVEKSWKMEL